MARKVDPSSSTTPPAIAEPDINDLAVIHPDLTVTLAGREITVREYRFIDGQRARAKALPLIMDLRKFTESDAVAEATTEDYLDVLARHDALVRELMLDSIEGADADWLESLSAEDGHELELAWWGVAGRFFVRRVLTGMRERLFNRLRDQVFAGPMSTPPSPMPDTAPESVSAPGTPSVN